MATPTATAARSRLDALLAGLTTAVLVLSVGLMGWGIVQPSPEPDELSPYTELAPGQPLRLVVTSKKINAPIVPIQVSPDAVLDPPADPEQVGWWDASARPGAARGQTVITGHTVHTGGGAMDRVVELRRGDVVEVVTRKGTDALPRRRAPRAEPHPGGRPRPGAVRAGSRGRCASCSSPAPTGTAATTRRTS